MTESRSENAEYSEADAMLFLFGRAFRDEAGNLVGLELRDDSPSEEQIKAEIVQALTYIFETRLEEVLTGLKDGSMTVDEARGQLFGQLRSSRDILVELVGFDPEVPLWLGGAWHEQIHPTFAPSQGIGKSALYGIEEWLEDRKSKRDKPDTEVDEAERLRRGLAYLRPDWSEEAVMDTAIGGMEMLSWTKRKAEEEQLGESGLDGELG